MWIELGIVRPGTTPGDQITWINTDHIARIEFVESPKLTASVITIKPGGSDKSVFYGDDAERLRQFLACNRYKICLPYEIEAFKVAQEAKKAAFEAKAQAEEEAAAAAQAIADLRKKKKH